MKKSKLILKSWDHCPILLVMFFSHCTKRVRTLLTGIHPRSLELQGLLKSVKLQDTEQDEYIHSLSRGGLWAANENVKGIAESAEISFRRHLLN